MTTNDPLAEAEAIIEAEATVLHDIKDKVEKQVTSLQRAACISHAQAHEALFRFGEAMEDAAKQSGLPMEEFLSHLPNDRRLLFMGMVIGAMTAGATLVFDINPEKFHK